MRPCRSGASGNDISVRTLRKRKSQPEKNEPQQANEQSDNESVYIVGEFRRFTPEEDAKILKYIVKKSAFDNLKRGKIWKEMAISFDNQRSSKSLKARFINVILSKIDTYCEELGFSSDVQDQFQQIKTNSCHTDGNAPRREYTSQDDDAIVDFVFNVQKPKKALSVSGIRYWQIAEIRLNEKHQLNRTWQSLKQRFKIRIVPFLHNRKDLFSSSHKKTAQHCYLAFAKKTYQNLLTKFEARRDQNKANLDPQFAVDDKDEGSDDDETQALIEKYIDKIQGTLTIKKEELDDSSEEMNENESTSQKPNEEAPKVCDKPDKVSATASQSSATKRVFRSQQNVLESATPPKVSRVDPLQSSPNISPPDTNEGSLLEVEDFLELDDPPSTSDLPLNSLRESVDAKTSEHVNTSAISTSGLLNNSNEFFNDFFETSANTPATSTGHLSPSSNSSYESATDLSPTPIEIVTRESHQTSHKSTDHSPRVSFNDTIQVVEIDSDDDSQVRRTKSKNPVSVYVPYTASEDEEEELPVSSSKQKRSPTKKTAGRISSSPPGISFLPAPNFKDLQKLYRLDDNKKEIIKRAAPELQDLTSRNQERALISRILQPSVRSRVSLKSNRRYVQ